MKTSDFHAELRALMEDEIPIKYSRQVDTGETIYHTHSNCPHLKKIKDKNLVTQYSDLKEGEEEARLCDVCTNIIICSYLRKNRTDLNRKIFQSIDLDE